MGIINSYSATFEGAVAKDVTCEKCGERYVYRAHRQAHGRGYSVSFLFSDLATAHAENEARKNLRSALAQAVEPVPCPQCRWLQTDMSREAHRRYFLGLWWFGLVLIVLGLATALPMLMLDLIGHRMDQVWPWWPGILAAGLGGGFMIIRNVKRRGYVPNDDGAGVERWAKRGQRLLIPNDEYDRLTGRAATGNDCLSPDRNFLSGFTPPPSK